jgi:hypothetical protein
MVTNWWLPAFWPAFPVKRKDTQQRCLSAQEPDGAAKHRYPSPAESIAHGALRAG